MAHELTELITLFLRVKWSYFMDNSVNFSAWIKNTLVKFSAWTVSVETSVEIGERAS